MKQKLKTAHYEWACIFRRLRDSASCKHKIMRRCEYAEMKLSDVLIDDIKRKESKRRGFKSMILNDKAPNLWGL